MDPQAAMMSAGGGGGGREFHAAPIAPYSLAEIWPFAINAAAAMPAGLSRENFAPMSGPVFFDGIVGNQNGGRARKRPEDDDSAKGVSTSGNGLIESDSKRMKTVGSNCKPESKANGEESSGKPTTEQPAKPSEPPKDYIHVRARRGQATDSHSLAERARREKISERMKILQDIVPGCNRVIGKALVLDEIINYIQSLQRQVEFLSMKLEAVNSRISPGIEGFPSKDFHAQTYDAASTIAFGSQATRDYPRGTSPDWLHMQIGGGFERTT